MKAAVVSAFGSDPSYADFPTPTAGEPHELVVDVLAAGLHPRARSQAAGSHYTSTAELPLVPGIDGVGRAADGTLRYFVLPDTVRGSMAERVTIDGRRSVVLPAGLGNAEAGALAAAMNPAMSSWVALRRRISFQPGQRVVVLGATGSAGRLAVQVASLLGARRVVAVGRDAGLLAASDATDTVRLGDADAAARLGELATDADVVLDYLWGAPAAEAMRAIVPARADDAQALTWVQIGSVAGATSALPSAALRATRLQIVGSGQGSVSTADILAELGVLATLIIDGTLQVRTRAVPLAHVEQTWRETADPGERIVFTPQP